MASVKSRHKDVLAVTGGLALADEQQYELVALHSAAHSRFSSDEIDIDDESTVELLLADVYALEAYREELRRAEQMRLDEAIAISLVSAEERMLMHGAGDSDEDNDEESDLVLAGATATESKPGPSCTCCLAVLADEKKWRVLPCGHLYCLFCITTRAGMAVRDRTLLPAHCCRKEFPIDYVKEALRPADCALYERFLKEKHWTSLDLESDKEYARTAKQNGCVQCPGCGIGVSRIAGCNRMKCCNGHEFCFDCGRAWKTCPCYYPGRGY